VKTKDISPGEYAHTSYPRSRHYWAPSRVRVLRTGVERTVGPGPSYHQRVFRDGVEIVALVRETGHKRRGAVPRVVPAEQILWTWAEQEEIERVEHEQALKRDREEMQHETLLAYARARLAVLGIKEGFEDEEYRLDWRHGHYDHLSFHPKALIALLDKLEFAPPLMPTKRPFRPTKRKGKLYVNGLVIAEDNGNGHFDHVYNALRAVAKHGAP
jgi:hypothetical protein